MPEIKAIQNALRAGKLDGWLFYDHHHRDPIAGRILGLPANGLVSRRWFYFIPSRGEPRKLVHRIEAGMLDSLPGRKSEYSSWEELHKGLAKLLGGAKRVAMQYSAQNNIPYIGLVDAGTIELVRKAGAKVESSADLVQVFAGTVLNITGQAVEVVAITMAVYLTISLSTALVMNIYNKRHALVER